MAASLTELHTVAEVRSELSRLRDDTGREGQPVGRTSLLTLVAWVPPQWQEAAGSTLEGLAHEQPSRAILLMPRAEIAAERSHADAPPWSAQVTLRAIDGAAGCVAAEVVTIDLARAAGAASIVLPLVRSDLPVFLRWRGPLPEDAEPFGALLGVADRLIIDSREWAGPGAGYAALRAAFGEVAVSDISWRRLEPWRRAVAEQGRPAGPSVRMAVDGPALEARLLAAWLGSRLRAHVTLEHREDEHVTRVAVDDEPIRQPRRTHRSSSALLSGELNQLNRDPIYEEAACALSSVTI